MASTQNYAIGHNLAGYSPDPDSTYIVESWEDAVEALKDHMREYADIADDATWAELNHDWSNGYTSGDYVETAEGVDFGDDAPSMLATVDSIITDNFHYLKTKGGTAEANFLVSDNDGRTIAFWIQPTDEEIDNA